MTAALCADCGNDSESARAQDAARRPASVRPAFTKLMRLKETSPELCGFIFSVYVK